MELSHEATLPPFHLLLVDDDPIQHFIVEHLLLTLAIPVELHTAHSVDEAIDHLARQSFDLVITDLNMPEKTGFDLLEYLAHKNTGIPVVVLSSSVLEDDHQAIYAFEQVEAFWQKPVAANTVFSMLNSKYREVA